MKISGSAVLHAQPAQVWQAINDPAVLARVIPGCDVLNPLGDGHFGMTVTLGVAAIKGSYSGEVTLYDLVEPVSLTMHATGSGGPGTVDTTVSVRLGGPGDGTTVLEYEADAVVGGMVGGVGQRVLTGVAKKTAGLFFSAIDDVLTGRKLVDPVPPADAADPSYRPVASPAVPPTALGAPGAVWAAPVAGVAPANTRTAGKRLDLLAAAAFGAVSMAVGVLIGARAARGGR